MMASRVNPLAPPLASETVTPSVVVGNRYREQGKFPIAAIGRFDRPCKNRVARLK